MGPWFVSIGLQSLLDSLATCTSPLLDQLLADLDEQTRAGVLRELHLVRARLIVILRAKFAFYLVVPYKALGFLFLHGWWPCRGEQDDFAFMYRRG